MSLKIGNIMILVNKCFEVIGEDGEIVESGFSSKNEEVTFKELIKLLSNYPDCSCYPSLGNTYEWFTNYDINFYSGNNDNNTIHFSRDNNARAEKYWTKAVLINK
jgi:hypothetical protein